MLSRFNIIVAVDLAGGIAKDGSVPWSSMTDGLFVRETTVGGKRNAVIMGRRTYEGIPMSHKPLADRHVYVISKSWRQEDHPEVTICDSILDALVQTGSRSHNQYEKVFVLGGEMVYDTVVSSYLYLCDAIYVTKYRMNYECDQHFPLDMVEDFPQFNASQNTQDYNRYFYKPDVVHPEFAFLHLLRKIVDTGSTKKTSGILVKELFGESVRFAVGKRLPIITTRQMDYVEIFKELLFWLSGTARHPECTPCASSTVDKPNVVFASLPPFSETSHIKKRNFADNYERGDYGPYEGFQLRHWGKQYDPTEYDLKPVDHHADTPVTEDETPEGEASALPYQGEDQIRYLTTILEESPSSHKCICVMWNFTNFAEQLQHPEVVSIQFCVTDSILSMIVSMRECNAFSQLPGLITKFSMFLAMMSHISNTRTGEVIFHFGHVYVYNTDLSNVEKQCNRTPRPFPFHSFRRAARLKVLDDFKLDNLLIEGYNSWPVITPKAAR